MIRRLGRGTKANTGDSTTTAHTGYDDQSETDSQSQFSEETNTAPQVLSSKGKAQVCTDGDKDCQWSLSELTAAESTPLLLKDPFLVSTRHHT